MKLYQVLDLEELVKPDSTIQLLTHNNRIVTTGTREEIRKSAINLNWFVQSIDCRLGDGLSTRLPKYNNWKIILW